MRHSDIALILLVLALLIAPGAAATLTPLGIAISDTSVRIEGSDLSVDLAEIAPGTGATSIGVYGIRPGRTAQIRLYQGDHLACTGSASYEDAGLWGSHANISLALGGSSVSWEELAPIGHQSAVMLRYGMSATDDGAIRSTGLLLSDIPPFGQSQDQYAYQEVAGIISSPVTRIEVISSDGGELRLLAYYAPAEELATALIGRSNPENKDFIGKLSSFVFSVLDIIMTGIGVFKFIFIDHFFAVIVLYESIALAYAASQSRSIIPFFQKFTAYNKGLIYFLMRVVQFVMDFFYKIIQALKPV
jgi:hypothetical protein